MSRVITFSTVFPSYHPKKGQPTYFVEKIWKSLIEANAFFGFSQYEAEYQKHFPCQYTKEENVGMQLPKHHTIRAGNRWKAGDMFSPRVWSNDINPKSGKKGAYHSKQIVIAPDMEIKKVWRFHMASHNGGIYVAIDSNVFNVANTYRIAENDGLSLKDFIDWFRINTNNVNSKFEGQIISWNENINY